MESNWFSSSMYACAVLKDGTVKKIPLEYYLSGGTLVTALPEMGDYSDIVRIDYAPDMGTARAGDGGYYVIPHGQQSAGDSFICFFREREDTVYRSEGFVMPMWGCVKPGGSYMAAVSSMTYEYSLTAAVTDGVYSIYPSFALNGEAPYEPVRIEYVLLEDSADYSDVALAYRRWRERRGEIRPCRDRVKGSPALSYAADSVYIRVRQAWKPVPPPVREQTPETEPPLHVAATFDDVSCLLDDLKAAGISKAEICLVGWNKSGHDGRWPQAFPVEEKLGGEEAIRALIQKAQGMGYAMVCHTNSTDAYSIADIWRETDLICGQDGAPVKNSQPWSGGDMYWVCPECGLRQAREILPRVRQMGFEGTHYIDVITTVFPRACHDPRHPVTRRQCVLEWNRILRLGKSLFGGISSEGGYDFAAPELDFGLYVSFGAHPCALADEFIPLWQLVYHGYILSNPYATTVNPTKEQLLKIAEYGGRPTFYYDSQFVTPQPDRDVNWMGAEDFHCATAEDRRISAAYIARVSRWYDKISYLQMIPMRSHQILEDGTRRVLYENGDEMIVNYRKGTASLNGEQILPLQS